MRRLIVLVIPLLALSCGKKSHGSKSSAPGPEVSAGAEGTGPFSYYIADPSKLPTCDEAHESALAYVVSEKAFYACSGGSWAAVEIEGPKGEKGDPGQVVDSFKEQLSETGLFVAMDSEGKLIGYTDSSTSSNPVRLTKDGFKAVVSADGITGEALCYFTQASCAGDCYIIDGQTKSASKTAGSICTPTTSSVSNVVWNADPTLSPFESRFEGGQCVPMLHTDPTPTAANKYRKGECQDFTPPFSIKKASETVQ